MKINNDGNYYSYRNADICDDRQDGMSWEDLSLKYNLSKPTLQRIVRKAGKVKTESSYFCEDLTEFDMNYTVMPKHRLI